MYESYVPRNIRDIGTQIQPLFTISFSLFPPLFLFSFSFTPFVFLTETRGVQRELECRDRSKGHRVPPARSVFPSGSCHFFSLFAFQLTLLLFPPVFCALVSSRPMLENYLSPRIGRDRVIFFSLDKFTRAEKNYMPMFVFFSYIFYYALKDTRYSFERRVCY